MENLAENAENHETFLARLRPLLAPSDLIRIEFAYTLAKYYHRHQKRKDNDEAGVPIRYFEHPRETALILIDEVKCACPDKIIAALLHDCLEDTDLSLPMIEFIFGSKVARIVALISKVPKEGYVDRLLAYGDWEALLVKACDHLHNLRSLENSPPEFQCKQIKESEEKYQLLFDKFVTCCPDNERGIARALCKEIMAARSVIKAGIST